MIERCQARIAVRANEDMLPPGATYRIVDRCNVNIGHDVVVVFCCNWLDLFVMCLCDSNADFTEQRDHQAVVDVA
jgi:hypothetical protein